MEFRKEKQTFVKIDRGNVNFFLLLFYLVEGASGHELLGHLPPLAVSKAFFFVCRIKSWLEVKSSNQQGFYSLLKNKGFITVFLPSRPRRRPPPYRGRLFLLPLLPWRAPAIDAPVLISPAASAAATTRTRPKATEFEEEEMETPEKECARAKRN